MAVEDAVDLLALAPDWFNQVDCLFWLGQGKAGIWLDLDGLFALGRSGLWLEKELAGWGIAIYAKMVMVEQGRLLALIVVDKRHERRVRNWLAKLGVLVQ